MALYASNEILASDFNSLKSRVKNEMNRRSYTNSLKGYAGTAYDYTTTPTVDEPILVEHINKIIEPINAIKPTGMASQQISGDPIKALNNVDAQLAAHEVFPIRGSGTDCAAGCSGLCSNSCTSCSGCSGCTSCDGCDGCTSCDGCDGCSGCTSCSGSCDGCTSCSGTCDGCTSCSGCSGCGTACGNDCTGVVMDY